MIVEWSWCTVYRMKLCYNVEHSYLKLKIFSAFLTNTTDFIQEENNMFDHVTTTDYYL